MPKKKYQTQKSEYKIPEGFVTFANEDEVHIVPEMDNIEHSLDFSCFCSPIILNKFQAAQGTEKLIYSHRYSIGLIN